MHYLYLDNSIFYSSYADDVISNIGSQINDKKVNV